MIGRSAIAVAVALAAVTAVAACTPQQVAKSEAGQLFCAIEAPSGPIVAALIDAATGGAAVIATNAAQSLVTAECALAGGVPVSPPANVAAAPVVAINSAQLASAAPAAPAATSP